MNLGQFGLRPAFAKRPAFSPGGYLTPVSGLPSINADATAVTTMFYTQDAHNALPVMRAGQFEMVAFSEDQLPLAGLNANSIYDLFSVDGHTSAKFGWGPAWQSAAAGAGARGTGIGTCEQLRLDGLLVNKYPIPILTKNGTLSVGEKRGLYLGSISIGSIAGQANFHRSYGQSRRWDAWNPYNRRPIALLAGDPNASWTTAPTTWRQSRGDATNFAVAFCGLPEEIVKANFNQSISQAVSSTTSLANIGIGINSTTVLSGKEGFVRTFLNAAVGGGGGTAVASASLSPVIGSNNFNMLEQAPTGTSNNTFFGAASDMLITLEWRG